jgi:hypothetical protein
MLSGRPGVNFFVSAQYLNNEMSDLNETWKNSKSIKATPKILNQEHEWKNRNLLRQN